MTRRHAFVTGAGGFIGRHLLRELQNAGWTTTGLVRRRDDVASIEQLGARVAVGDLSDPALRVPDLSSGSVVFNLAASMTTWEQGIEQGGLTTEGLIKLMARSGTRRLIHISSAAVHGSHHAGRIVDESLQLGPHPSWNYYARQKLESEELVRQAQAEGRLSATIVRPSKVLGAGDPGLVPWAAKLLTWPAGALASDRNCRHPVVVVEELARGLVACAEAESTAERAYYASSSFEITQGDLLNSFVAAGMPIPRPGLAHSLGFAAGRIGVTAMDASWRVVRPGSPGPRASVIATLERRAGFPVDHDCVISSQRASVDFGWRGTADLEAAINAAVRWHLSRQANHLAPTLT